MSDRTPIERVFDTLLFISVPTVVYAMAAVRWIIDPFHIRNRIVGRLLPELSRFPSATSRFIALHSPGRTGILVQVILTGAAVLMLSGGIFSAIWWAPSVARHITPMTPSVVAVLAIITAWVMGWMEIARVALLKEETRRCLRRQLVAIGLRTCVTCGYNLKGITCGRCPECGVEYEK
ncbi:MAG: hypothetical protein KF841_08550 [Phycisphaerae bacterium]|nr:hypothetical protein [Phycisphaerae bacterium]